MLFCQQTHKTHSYYHLVTAEPLFIRIKISSIQQKQNIKREYRMLPSIKTNSSFSKSVMMFVAAQKWELFFVEPKVKSQWTILVKYLTISISVNCYQTHCRQQYYLPFSNSCCAKLSTSFLLSYGPNRPELNSVDYKILGVYCSVNMSCKSTKLKKWNSDWLNSGGKAVLQHLSESMRFSFVFLCFPR